MNIRYRPLFTVAINHSYCTSACRDMDFFVPQETGILMQNGKILTRLNDGMLQVFYEADDSNAPISDITGQTLTFGLRLKNPYFDNVTAPTLIETGLMPFHANAATPGNLDAAIGVQLAGGLYSHAPQKTNRPVILSLADRDGHIAMTQTLAAPGASEAFDLRGLPCGVWTMTEDYGSGLIQQRIILLNPDLRDTGAWGVVAIKVATSFYTSPAAFALNFTARQQRLQYYIVASKFGTTEFDQLGMVDAGFIDEVRAEVKFDKVLPAAFTPADVSPSLLGETGDGNIRVVLFQSQTPVARRERGLKKIHLQRNGDVLIEHLPQPSPDRAAAQVIIHLTKP